MMILDEHLHVDGLIMQQVRLIVQQVQQLHEEHLHIDGRIV